MTPVRWVRWAVGVVVVVGASGGCVTPALNGGAFIENGKGAMTSALSATATGHAALEARLAGHATKAYADVVVTDSEKAIAPIEASFGGVQPPSPDLDPTRTAVLDALSKAGDALSDARIAVRRDDDDAMRQAISELDDAAAGLSKVQDGLG